MRVLHRDDAWLVLDKPAGVVTAPPTSRAGPTLVDEARRRCPAAARHHPISRLDADVTGAVAFALTQAAIDRAVAERERGRYRRLYVGLVAPPPATAAGRWAWPVAVDRKDRTRRTAGPGDDPREALTRYAVVATAGPLALAAFAPVTGRTHQIRVHAKAAGSPIAGDVAYGGARRLVLDDGAVVAVPRVMLHAWRVRLPGTDRVVEAPPPEDLRAAWRECGGDEAALAAWDDETLTRAFGGD